MDESDRPSLSRAGTEPEYGYPVLEETSYLHPVHASSPRFVSRELRRSPIPQSGWPAHSPISTHGPASAERPPLLLPPTLRAAPALLYANGSCPPHSRSNMGFHAYPMISEPDSHLVAMPIPTGQHPGGLIDARSYHYGPSFSSPKDDSMVGYPSLPSQFIAMPIAPTSLGAGASSHMVISDFRLDPTLGQSPFHPSQHMPLYDSTASPSPSRNFNSPLYFSPTPPLSMSDLHHAHIVSPPQMPDLTPSQPHMTQPTAQHHPLTVPLEDVEFPPVICPGELLFFQCRWAECGMWITSEKEAVKNHLTSAHNVELRGRPTDPVSCEWIDCSSSPQRSGLVRHFHTHLGLKWRCSVCRTAYTRPDSVGGHARDRPQCDAARAISYPSAAAYSARINEDNTVTMTKLLQP